MTIFAALFGTDLAQRRVELSNARRALESVPICGPVESDEYLDANDRVIQAERLLPWWARIFA